VKGRGSSQGGQGVDDKQAMEWKGSCKWSSAITGVHSVSIIYSGVPGLGTRGSSGRMVAPNLEDTVMNERLYDWYLRWLRWAVIPTDARLS
jgi:hypothetical protein